MSTPILAWSHLLTLYWGLIAAEVITRVGPSFHGLYRAVISTPFPWSLSEWRTLSSRVDGLFTVHLIDRLNTLLTEYLEMAADPPDDYDGGDRDPVFTPQGATANPSQTFVSTLVLRYVDAERPLSGYFLVCSLMEIQWVVLGQVLAPNPPDASSPTGQRNKTLDEEDEEAAAANNAWAALVDAPATQLDLEEDDVESGLRNTLTSAMKCFEDLLVQIEEMDVEPSIETYAYETMAESLVSPTMAPVDLNLTGSFPEIGFAMLSWAQGS